MFFLLTGNRQEYCSGLLPWSYKSVYVEDWCWPIENAIPTTHGKWDGSLRLRLLGLWAQNIICNSFLFCFLLLLFTSYVMLISVSITWLIDRWFCTIYSTFKLFSLENIIMNKCKFNHSDNILLCHYFITWWCNM